MTSTQSLAILGAGASGLVSCRHLSSLFSSTTIFEKTDSIGGVWKYRQEGSTYAHANAMYESLHTNLSHHIMAFLDFPFRRGDLMREKGLESQESKDLVNFPSHKEVYRYLLDYARYFDLERNVELETEVILVERVQDQWRITTRPVHETTSQFDQARLYDVLIVANGHYIDPYIPEFPGQEECENLMHSSSYKTLDWTNQRFVLVGVGPSGGEIARELAQRGGNEVFLVARSLSQALPREQCKSGGALEWITSTIKEARDKGRTMEFHDGTVVENIDHIMLCTGYNYTFPFLENSPDPDTNEPIVRVQDNQVMPLYKHVAHTKYYKSLYFVGLPFKTIPFPLAEFQVLWIKHVQLGKVHLPLDENGLLPEDTTKTAKQERSRHFHNFSGDYQWVYLNDLARDCGLPGVDPKRIAIYDEIGTVRNVWSNATFRHHNYKSIRAFEKVRQNGQSENAKGESGR